MSNSIIKNNYKGVCFLCRRITQTEEHHICFMSVDTLRDRLADKYLSLCHYNDFHELNLEKIVDTLNDVYDNLIEEMERGFHFKD